MALIDDALCMAEHGIRVHPLRPRAKIPTLRAWQSARLTPDDVRRTFRDNNNVGVVLGEQLDGAQLIVIDCDGEKWLEWALDRFPDPVLLTRNSMTGGGHIWYRWSGLLPKKRILAIDRDDKHSNAQLLSAGAQVVVPPSVHPSGRVYRWYVDGAEASTVEAMASLVRVPILNAPALRDICPPPPPKPKPPALLALGVDLRSVDLLAAFRMRGMIRREIGPGKYAVICPWDNGHTDPDPDPGSANTSSVIGPISGGGHWFKCLHASCDGRPYMDVLEALGVDTVSRAATRSASAGAITRRVAAAQSQAQLWRKLGV